MNFKIGDIVKFNKNNYTVAERQNLTYPKGSALVVDVSEDRLAVEWYEGPHKYTNRLFTTDFKLIGPTEENIEQLIKHAVLVAYWRCGDVDTEDGVYATTEIGEMTNLENSIEALFGKEVHEVFTSLKNDKYITNLLSTVK